MTTFDNYLRDIIKKNPVNLNYNNKNFLKNKKEVINKLRSLANENSSSKHSKILEIINYKMQSKHIKILDYGCGGGVPLVLLKMAGYDNINGVDLNTLHIHKLEKQKYFSNMLEFQDNTFSFINNNKTDFKDKEFDCVISLQVLEHVKDFKSYYNEISRVLKNNGKLILIFPHRFKIYDSHSKLYFVHYLPKFIRGIFYDLLTKEKKDYYENLLNLKSPFFHIKYAKKYFKRVKNIRDDDYIKNNENSYDGNITLKKIFNLIIKFTPNFIRKFLFIFLLDSILICESKNGR